MNRFARLLIIALVGLGISVVGGQTASAQFGIAGGLNFESADDITSESAEATLDNKTGYHFGVVYDIGIGPASFRPGVIYRRIGTYDFETASFDLSAIEVPLDVRLRVLSTPALRPYVLAGPMFTFPRGEDDFEDAVEDLSFSLNVGVGLELGGSDGGMRLLPEIRYEFGATEFIKDDFEIAGQEFSPQSDPRFSALSLRLHLLF